MKRSKWMKGLKKSTVSNILECDPDKVEFKLDLKRGHVLCAITRGNERSLGLAICSELDVFNYPEGANLSATRAVTAMVNKKSSDMVRLQWSDYPNTWTKKRIDRMLAWYSGGWKCLYLLNGVRI